MRPASIRFVPLRDQKSILTDFGFHWLGGVMRRQFLPQKHQPSYSLDAWDYAREDFDYANTYIGHYEKASTFVLTSPDSPLRTRGKIPPVGPRILELITEFVALCHARGAQCFYTCPPQPPDLLTTNIEEIQRNIERLKEIPHLTVLDTPREHVYSLEQLFDVQYHLTKEGATRRTRLVVDHLRQLR